MRNQLFTTRLSNGKLWPTGKRSIWNLCGTYNHATNPALSLTDEEHARTRTIARSVKKRMRTLGYVYGKDYRELSNGELWPIKEK